jgi:hypothetical protein
MPSLAQWLIFATKAKKSAFSQTMGVAAHRAFWH